MPRGKPPLAPHALRVMPGDPALRRQAQILFHHDIQAGNEFDAHETIKRSAGLEATDGRPQPAIGKEAIGVTGFQIDIIAIILAEIIRRIGNDQIDAFRF